MISICLVGKMSADSKSGQKNLFILHGLPAAGKFTLGSLTHQTLVSLGKSVRFFHNHLVVDAVKSLFDFGTEAFIEMRRKIWLDLFDRAFQDTSIHGIIFTFAFEKSAAETFDQILALAATRNVRVHLINLKCDVAKVIERCNGSDRGTKGSNCCFLPLPHTSILESKFVYEGELTSSLVIDTTNADKQEASAILSKYILDQY